MRDILDIFENLEQQSLSESTGLANRKPGDIFTNADDQTISFDSIEFYPKGGGKFDAKQLDAALKQVSPLNVKWQNARNARTGGFAIMKFEGPNESMYFGRYLEQVKPVDRDNYIPNQVDGYSYAGRAAAKAKSGVSPQDLLTQKNDLKPNAILKQLESKLGLDSPLYKVAYELASGAGLPIKFPIPPDVTFEAFRDYFCEILQPIALQTGQFTGNAADAAEIFLGGDFSNTTITFDDSKTAGLSDSILSLPDGRFIKLSSKGGRGAEASAKNLVDSLKELEETPNGKKLLRKYKEEVDIIKKVQEEGQNGAPLYLGVKFRIINEKEAEQIRRLRNLPAIDLDNLKNINITDRLKKYALNRQTADPDAVNLYYHLIASIAHQAAIKVNDETNFSDAARDILNNGALVQVYTKASRGTNEWTLTSFDTVYPSKTIKGVYFSAGKNYFSTGIKGNFTFKIDKGTGKPDNDDQEGIGTPISLAPNRGRSLDLSVAAKSIVEPKLKAKKKSTGPNRKKRKK